MPIVQANEASNQVKAELKYSLDRRSRSDYIRIGDFYFTPEQVAWRKALKNSFYMTAKILCGFNEDSVARGILELPMNKRIHGSTCYYLQYVDWNRFLLLLPRGFFKTSLISVAYVIWKIINNPAIRIGLAVGIEDHGKNFIRGQQAVLDSQIFRGLFPDIAPSNKKESEYNAYRYTVKRPDGVPINESTVQLMAIKGTKASQHFDIIIGDDLVNDDNYDTPGGRAKVKSYIHDILPPLLVDQSKPILILGTHWQEDDAYVDMEKSGNWDVINLSVRDDQGHSVYPEKYPDDELARMEKEMDAKIFSANMLNRTIAEGTTHFSQYPFTRYEPVVKDGKPTGEFLTLEEKPQLFKNPIIGVVTAVDVASYKTKQTTYMRREGQDRNAIVVCIKDSKGNIFVPYILMGRNWMTSELVQNLEFVDTVYSPLAFGIEVVGAMQIQNVVGDAESLKDSRIKGKLHELHPHGNKKPYRIRGAIQPLLQAGRIFFHKGIPEAYIREIKMYPEVSFDDCPDALAYAIQLFQELNIRPRIDRGHVQKLHRRRIDAYNW